MIEALDALSQFYGPKYGGNPLEAKRNLRTDLEKQSHVLAHVSRGESGNRFVRFILLPSEPRGFGFFCTAGVPQIIFRCGEANQRARFGCALPPPWMQSGLHELRAIRVSFSPSPDRICFPNNSCVKK